jgi:hypothetical protein
MPRSSWRIPRRHLPPRNSTQLLAAWQRDFETAAPKRRLQMRDRVGQERSAKIMGNVDIPGHRGLADVQKIADVQLGMRAASPARLRVDRAGQPAKADSSRRRVTATCESTTTLFRRSANSGRVPSKSACNPGSPIPAVARLSSSGIATASIPSCGARPR